MWKRGQSFFTTCLCFSGKSVLVVMEFRIFYGILCNPGSCFHLTFITLFKLPFWGLFFSRPKKIFSGQENIFFWAGKKIALGRHFFTSGIFRRFEYRKSGKMLQAFHIFPIRSSAVISLIRVKANHFFPRSFIEAPML